MQRFFCTFTRKHVFNWFCSVWGVCVCASKDKKRALHTQRGTKKQRGTKGTKKELKKTEEKDLK